MLEQCSSLFVIIIAHHHHRSSTSSSSGITIIIIIIAHHHSLSLSSSSSSSSSQCNGLRTFSLQATLSLTQNYLPTEQIQHILWVSRTFLIKCFFFLSFNTFKFSYHCELLRADNSKPYKIDYWDDLKT